MFKISYQFMNLILYKYHKNKVLNIIKQVINETR